LFDPNTGQSLGTVGGPASLDVRARLARRRRDSTDSRKWQVLWGADFGYARQEADVRGEVVDATSDVGVRDRPDAAVEMVGGQTLGLSGAWKHAFVSREENPDRSTTWAYWRSRGAGRGSLDSDGSRNAPPAGRERGAAAQRQEGSRTWR
jgi:hypothetical protein